MLHAADRHLPDCSIGSRSRHTARGSAVAPPKVVERSIQTQASQRRQCILIDRHRELVEYTEGWELQKECLARVQEANISQAGGNDYLILLQHHPVFTLGAGSDDAYVNFDISEPPLPIHRVERGGEVTHHGPGQLVLYPILDLTHHRKDLHWYMRSLEEVVIRSLLEVSGLQGQRIDGLTGVWIDGHKVAAIGVRAQRWVTYHGLAINLDMDLAPFDMIVPCGISDRQVSMVSEMVQQQQQQQHDLGAALSTAELVEEYHYSLLQSFEEVFNVELCSPPT